MERFLVQILFISIFSSQAHTAEKIVISTDKNSSNSRPSNNKDKQKEDEEQKLTFTDKISSIRSVSGEYDVFFVNHSGTPYDLPYTLSNWKRTDQTPEEFLREAFKLHAEVTVTVDTITETIISLSGVLPRTPASNSESYNLPPELDYLKDIINGSPPDKK